MSADEYSFHTHEFAPVYDEYSRILILGSFPSVKSREQKFYYGNPQNRFWKVLSAVMQDDTPLTVSEKISFLHKHHIALWDVISQCEIIGSSDASIRNAVPTDLSLITKYADIRVVYCNGSTAFRLYNKYQKGICKMEAVLLPSTSPANASWSLERLIAVWSCLRHMN